MRHDRRTGLCSSPIRNFNPRAYVRHDRGSGRRRWDGYDFNPRAYVRHDSAGSLCSAASLFQSTCLREARLQLNGTAKSLGVFQSTCLREARRLTFYFNPTTILFQSTCLREARRSEASTTTNGSNFNPRAYVRHDNGGGKRRVVDRHFHPRAYVRHDVSVPARTVWCAFQSTCLREARRNHDGEHPIFPISIHVPT